MEDVVSALQRVFRLTRYEAQLYLAILRGAGNAKEASIISGVPLPRIYDVIRVLESKGYVVRDAKGWYRAVPPRSVALAEAARLEEETRRRIRDMSSIASLLESRIASSRGPDGGVYVASTIYGLVSSVREKLPGSTTLLVAIYDVYMSGINGVRALIREAHSLGVRVLVAHSVRARPDLGDESGYVDKIIESPCVYLDMVVSNKVAAVSLYNSREGEIYSLVTLDEPSSSRLLEYMMRVVESCRA